MAFQPTSSALNHLLSQNSWALPRLARFAGKTVRFDIAPLSFACTILDDGTLRNADPADSADAIFAVAPSLLPRLALRDEKAYAEIHSEGSATLLAEIFSLARNLRWDIAEDLSNFTGDIVAERIVQTAQAGQQQLHSTLLSLSQAVAGHWPEQRALLAKQRQFSELSRQVDCLRDDILQLELRLERLLVKDNK